MFLSFKDILTVDLISAQNRQEEIECTKVKELIGYNCIIYILCVTPSLKGKFNSLSWTTKICMTKICPVYAQCLLRSKYMIFCDYPVASLAWVLLL